jgi:hypothetical protein
MIGGIGNDKNFTDEKELVEKFKMNLSDHTLDPSYEKRLRENLEKYKIMVQKDTSFTLPSS